MNLLLRREKSTDFMDKVKCICDYWIYDYFQQNCILFNEDNIKSLYDYLESTDNGYIFYNEDLERHVTNNFKGKRDGYQYMNLCHIGKKNNGHAYIFNLVDFDIEYFESMYMSYGSYDISVYRF